MRTMSRLEIKSEFFAHCPAFVDASVSYEHISLFYYLFYWKVHAIAPYQAVQKIQS